jgi:hypothetical protein
MPFEKVSFPLKTAALPAKAALSPGKRLSMRSGLILGFGVLLILLVLSGLSALRALSEVQTANESTLRQFLAKNQQLDEIRAAVYLSGTYLRDYLLEPDLGRAKPRSRRCWLRTARSPAEATTICSRPSTANCATTG